MEIANKFPLLEELHISFCDNISKDSLEVIGRCCPLLKSLKFLKMHCGGLKCDKEAFAIAKTMPKLRHLDIYCNALTNVGLIAILDGCPLLESLNVRGCIHLNLSGSLGTRCCEQIKEFLFDARADDSYREYIDYLSDYFPDLLSDSEFDLPF